MYTEKTTNLPHFMTAKAETLVFELFYLFEQSGRWCDSREEMCRRLMLTDEEREAECQKWIHTPTEEHEARAREAVAKMGNFAWLRHDCEFGLWRHTRIDRNDVVIHAFMIGYTEAGKSDDPNLYVIHRPGDEDDLDKINIVTREIDFSSVLHRKRWVNQPIIGTYMIHQQLMEQY